MLTRERGAIVGVMMGKPYRHAGLHLRRACLTPAAVVLCLFTGQCWGLGEQTLGLLRATNVVGIAESLPALALEVINREFSGVFDATDPILAAYVWAADSARFIDLAGTEMETVQDKKLVEQVLAWYHGPLGKKLIDVQNHGNTKTGRDALLNYLHSFNPSAMSPARRKRIERISVGTELAPNMTALIGSVSHGFVAGFRAVANPFNPLGAQQHVDLRKSIHAQLDEQAERRALATVEHRLEGFSGRELDSYIQFIESPAGRWLYPKLTVAMAKGFEDIAQRYALRLTEVVATLISREDIQLALKEGQLRGTQLTDRVCVEAGLSRAGRCATFKCHLLNSIQSGSCLNASAASTATVCDEVPELADGNATSLWRNRVCEKLERTASFCGMVLGRFQNYCGRRRQAGN